MINWKYAKLPLASDPHIFGPFSAFVGMWRQKAQAGELPPRRGDFDFPDFRPWLGKVSIAKIERDPFEIRFVLWGTQLTTWWGVDYSNKLLGQASITPAIWKSVEGAYFEAMDRDPFIGVVCGYLDQHNRSFIKVLGVDLPLSDGAGLSHVLTLHLEIELDETIESALPDCSMLEYF
ncbi:MAG: hypothetical protein JNL25_14720 [Rhodospirillaceae bacterium]|nr:hypothetical protein [Rhodospirillaceae bacterium]